jgi:Zn-dependent protease
MRESASWTVSLGRWSGLDVRLHASLLVCAVLTVFLCSQTGATSYVAEYSLLGLGILLISVLLHELGHILAAVHLGGRAERIVLGPLGGLSLPQASPEPHRDVLVALAGPAVNLLIIMLVAPLLIMAEVDLSGLLFSPLDPQQLFEGETWLVAARLTCWINCLLLLNLYPAYPLDGGHALAGLLRPIFGGRAAVLIVGSSAMLTALGLLVLALLLPVDTRLLPTWLPLSLFAIFLFFSGKQQMESWRAADSDETVLGYDFSEGYTSLERSNEPAIAPAPGFLARWIEQRRANRRKRMAQIEAEEERRVDEVLARLNEVGIDALSIDERKLLKRVSRRYRQRLGSE